MDPTMPDPDAGLPFLRVISFQVYAENPNDLVKANEMLARIQALLAIDKVSSSLRVLTVDEAISEGQAEIEHGEEEI